MLSRRACNLEERAVGHEAYIERNTQAFRSVQSLMMTVEKGRLAAQANIDKRVENIESICQQCSRLVERVAANDADLQTSTNAIKTMEERSVGDREDALAVQGLEVRSIAAESGRLSTRAELDGSCGTAAGAEETLPSAQASFIKKGAAQSETREVPSSSVVGNGSEGLASEPATDSPGAPASSGPGWGSLLVSAGAAIAAQLLKDATESRTGEVMPELRSAAVPPVPPPPATHSRHIVRLDRAVEAKAVSKVRDAYDSKAWKVGGSEPPQWLNVSSAPRFLNPVYGLGVYGESAQKGRPAFVTFCVGYIIKHFKKESRLVYATLGSGGLYHDWEVIEQLIKHGRQISAVHAVDHTYSDKGGSVSSSALRCLAAWLAALDVKLYAYKELEQMISTAGPVAHVMMQGDVNYPDARLCPAMRLGGIHLHMTRGGKWMEAWTKPSRALSDPSMSIPPLWQRMLRWHASMDGLHFIELRNSHTKASYWAGEAKSMAMLREHAIQLQAENENRVEIREDAFQRRMLWRVVAEGVPNEMIGILEEPRKDAKLLGLCPRGTELVTEEGTLTKDGFIKLSHDQVEKRLESSRNRGYVLIDGASLGFGKLLTQVRDESGVCFG